MENMYCDLETDDDEMRDYESIMLKINTARGDVPVQKVDTVHRRKDLDLL